MVTAISRLINMMLEIGLASSNIALTSMHEYIIRRAIRPWSDYLIQLYKKVIQHPFSPWF